MKAVISQFLSVLFVSIIVSLNTSSALKPSMGTFHEHVGPVYCIADWTCNNYCFPYDKVPCCASANKMGAEVKFGTCHCCETWTLCNDQAALGCGTCEEVYVRSYFDFKDTKPCPKKSSGNIFTSIFSKQAQSKEEDDEVEGMPR